MKYNEYLFDILSNKPSIIRENNINGIEFKNYISITHPNHVMIISRHCIQKDMIYSAGISIIVNDVNRKSCHMVKINEPFIIKYIKHKINFGIYQEHSSANKKI